MNALITFAGFVAILLCSMAYAVNIDFVPIGNPGNAPDTRYESPGYGSVGYEYQIGKYEVTAGQYTEFLNAVAASDPNRLYNESMAYDPFPDWAGANIIRSGSPGTYSYSVAADWANRPVNYVSFWDAARFANWLHNGQPTGPQGPDTTEDGAYLNIGNQATFARQLGAKFVIPTEDEWYKAAYHDQGAGLAASYFDYPMATNSTPSNDLSNPLPDPGNNANFYDTGFTIDSPYHRTEVGDFENSASPYGTFDQGGNVWEWNETTWFSSQRGLRGGAFNEFLSSLHASSLYNHVPVYSEFFVGFRVASLLESELISGDFDHDGDVDGRDFLEWQRGDSSNPLSAGDLADWQTNYGTGTLGTSTAVPEPTVTPLLLLAAASLLSRAKG